MNEHEITLDTMKSNDTETEHDHDHDHEMK